MTDLVGRQHLHGQWGDARNGAAFLRSLGLRVIFSDGGGWDHVSVSVVDRNRCPTWEEMCAVKDLFFAFDDVVVQYHPRRADYRNAHPFCLHLWRCQTAPFLTPPPWMIAPDAYTKL